MVFVGIKHRMTRRRVLNTGHLASLATPYHLFLFHGQSDCVYQDFAAARSSCAEIVGRILDSGVRLPSFLRVN